MQQNLVSVEIINRVEIVQKEIDELEMELRETLNAKKDGYARHAKHLDYYLDHLKKVLAALNAGYEEITIPRHDEWLQGYIGPDPRPFKWFKLELFAIPVIIFTVIFLTIPALRDAQIIGIFIALSMFATISFIDGKNQNALLSAGFPFNAKIRFLEKPIPEFAMKAYLRALYGEFFDSIQVVAPTEAFSKTAVTVDPIIFGLIGRQAFFIAQFDLATDQRH